MTTAFQRGILLVQQDRFDLAEREFRQELSQNPDHPVAHAFLALCLTNQGRHEEALREADEAVRGAPDDAFHHYVKGFALKSLRRTTEAEVEANAAIGLDPTDVDSLALLASVKLDQRNWTAALEAADRGLALDPEHAGCLNLRAMALVNLGRKIEAASTLGSALADDPQNPLTHANQGWTLLHQGNHQAALEHFREALRLDPDLEWARVGVIEALKARFVIYRVMLGFFLWMGRQSRFAQLAVVFGIIFGQNLLAWISDAVPALAPFLTPILILSFGFLLMTWISSPLFNLTLRFNTFGRMALSREQRVESNWIGGCFVIALTFVVMYFCGFGIRFFGMFYFGMLLFPLAVTFRMDRGNNRTIAAILTLGLAVVGAVGIGMLFVGQPGGLLANARPKNLLQLFLFGSMFSTWLPALLGRAFGG